MRSAEKLRTRAKPFEAIAICPKCKSLEVVLIINDVLVPTPKYVEKDRKIYHICGTRCQLFNERYP